MRRAATAFIALVMLAGCGGNNGEEPAPGGVEPAPEGPVATATPLAEVPETTIVSGSDTGGGAAPGNGGATEDAVTYTVEPGDSLTAIADRFGVSTEAIQEANALDGTDIFVGDQLTIPRAAAPAEEPADPANGDQEPDSDPPPPTDGDVYTVEAGDTPLGIALMFDVTLEALEEANGGPGSLDALQVDQEIVIPQ